MRHRLFLMFNLLNWKQFLIFIFRSKVPKYRPKLAKYLQYAVFLDSEIELTLVAKNLPPARDLQTKSGRSWTGKFRYLGPTQTRTSKLFQDSVQTGPFGRSVRWSLSPAEYCFEPSDSGWKNQAESETLDWDQTFRKIQNFLEFYFFYKLS